MSSTFDESSLGFLIMCVAWTRTGKGAQVGVQLCSSCVFQLRHKPRVCGQPPHRHALPKPPLYSPTGCLWWRDWANSDISAVSTTLGKPGAAGCEWCCPAGSQNRTKCTFNVPSMFLGSLRGCARPQSQRLRLGCAVLELGSEEAEAWLCSLKLTEKIKYHSC